jgi:hypothetical protein
LTVAYIVFALLGDARAASGSDAGGKIATVKVMAERGSWSPDIGYWAARWDPDGDFHPIYYTYRTDDEWVQVTTLPLVYLGVPLWHAFGAGGLLLIPIAGSVLAAVAARRLARLLGAERGWAAFWLVGLASPMLFYAGDLWEHTMGVGLGVLAICLVLERPSARRAAFAGALVGTAAILRTEVLAYGFALAVVVLVAREERRWWMRHRARALVGIVGGVVPLALYQVIEREIVGAAIRSSRAASNVSSSVAASELPARARDALVTSFTVFPDDSGRSIVLGVALAVAVLVVGRALRRGAFSSPAERAGGVIAIGVLAVRVVDGLGFVPGMFAAAPAAAAGVGSNQKGRATVVTAIALVALPVVWAFQWRGQLVPQWGGRYVLISGVLLTVVAAVAVERAPRSMPAIVVIFAAVSISLFGAAWHIERTHEVATAIARIDAVPRDVVIVSGIAHLGREGGYFYGRRRWLSSAGGGDLRAAVAVARRAGARRIDVVALGTGDDPAPPAYSGYRYVSRRVVDFLGFPLQVRRYARVG